MHERAERVSVQKSEPVIEFEEVSDDLLAGVRGGLPERSQIMMEWRAKYTLFPA